MEKDKKAEAEEKIEQKLEEASEDQKNEQQDKAADLDPPASTSEVKQDEEQSLLGEDTSLGEELLAEEELVPVAEPFVGFSEGPDGTVRNPEGKVAYAPPGSHNAAMAGVQQDASGHVESLGLTHSDKSGTRV